MPDDNPLQRKTTAAVFDPAAGLFLAQDSRPGALTSVDPRELSPLQRALLAIDGTVTSFLSAWAMEPIVVRPLGQRPAVLSPGDAPGGGTAWIVPWLDAPFGTPVIERAVLLLGAESHRLFAFAESVICPDRLPETLRAGLRSGGLSLGQLLLMPGFESRREGLWYGRERPASVPAAVAALAPADFLTRTYRVTAGSRPLMVITERFPWSLRA
jgi:chorismate-pyruvate lyase